MNKMPNLGTPGWVRCSSKQYAHMFNQAEANYKKAVCDAERKIIPAVVIAMYENSQVKWNGVTRWADTMVEMVKNLNESADSTIFHLLEEETGLEIQIGNGESYKNQAFANYEIHDKVMQDSQTNPQKWILYFQRKSRWCTASVMACCLLACNRQFNWAADGKIDTIRAAAEDIMDWYNRKPKAIESEFARVTGHKVDELYDRIQ